MTSVTRREIPTAAPATLALTVSGSGGATVAPPSAAPALDPMSLVDPELRPMLEQMLHTPPIRAIGSGQRAEARQNCGFEKPAAMPVYEMRTIPGPKAAPSVRSAQRVLGKLCTGRHGGPIICAVGINGGVERAMQQTTSASMACQNKGTPLGTAEVTMRPAPRPDWRRSSTALTLACIRATVPVVLLGLLVVSSHALAETGSGVEPGADCPSAHTPYSSKTVLLDLLINPATRSVLQRDAPDLFTGVPDLITRTTIPTFAAIVNVAWVSASTNMPLQAAAIARLDADLSAIPVTEAATRARCARYDEGPSGLPATVREPSVLVFSKSTGARDDTAINAAAGALRKIGIAKGWTLVSTENGSAINDVDLSHFNLVVWNNVSGDVLTLAQRQSLRRYVERGGGFAALHGSGGDFVYDWDWYIDSLIGARFVGHPRSHGFQPATIVVDDSHSWITHGLPLKWTMRDEWYSFKASPRLSGAHVLASLDESTYDPTEGKLDLHMGDHPIAWTRCVGDGRSFYTALGHRPENYDEPHFRRLLERATAWAAGQGPTSCVDGKEIQQRFKVKP